MVRTLMVLSLIAAIGITLAAPAQADAPQVELQTSLGTVVIELDPKAAPKTVDNFLAYVKSGFYNDTVFHRVIKGFMIQGGGLTADMQKKKTRKPVANEADNGLKNSEGTIAMARTSDPNSATAQFFINVADNKFLNHKGKTPRGWGYCVFGKVTQGMDVIKKIESVRTGVLAGRRDVPVKPVFIVKATIVEKKKKEAQ